MRSGLIQFYLDQALPIINIIAPEAPPSVMHSQYLGRNFCHFPHIAPALAPLASVLTCRYDIVGELTEYARDINPRMAREAVKAVGRIALSVRKCGESLLRGGGAVLWDLSFRRSLPLRPPSPSHLDNCAKNCYDVFFPSGSPPPLCPLPARFRMSAGSSRG